MKTSVRVI